ncbi:hypothetical protein HN014_03860 [Aquimarina sp. TRL1]|uniref:hypothetical protein n=1 Tax=Aquimarina sp. (strain TRL1) TaxID=2736252 RepID=UPI00158F0B51|nr:hypothetical protein [Aquimarina sp. TRL1]QKX04077.1 hypothetical protein HN014_03860 [Aquimarina sp. TRL1]
MKNKAFFSGIWCLFLTLSVCAQDNSLKKQLKLLQNESEHRFLMDSTGFSKIKTATFITKSIDADELIANGKNIHLVDFNNDGHKDMIYQDFSPYATIILLAKKDKGFVEIWNGSGTLVNLNHGEKNTIYTLIHAIGCYYKNRLSMLVVNSDNTITQKTIELYSETKISTISKTFEQRIISGVLRTQPVIDNKQKTDPCTGELKTGNQIRTIKNKTVTVIKTQNRWVLVVLKENDQSSIGWVKI